MADPQPIVNLSGIEDFIPNIAALLGLDPATVLLLLAIISMAANVVSKMIPDDATGWQSTVRKITTWIGLAFPNRIAHGLNVNDIAKAVVTRQVTKVAESLPKDTKQELKDQLEEVIPAFPGLKKD